MDFSGQIRPVRTDRRYGGCDASSDLLLSIAAVLAMPDLRRQPASASSRSPQVRSAASCGRRATHRPAKSGFADACFRREGLSGRGRQTAAHRRFARAHRLVGRPSRHRAALADAGFIVAAIDHPIDSDASKTTRIEDIAYLTERPADIKRLDRLHARCIAVRCKHRSRTRGLFRLLTRWLYRARARSAASRTASLLERLAPTSCPRAALCRADPRRQVS